MSEAWDWMVGKWRWPGAAGFAGVILVLLAPAVYWLEGAVAFWIYLQLPLYMLHQLEEHAGDRFREFANRVIGGGVEVLSRKATFLINSLGVWGVDLGGIYLALQCGPGWALVVFYLPLVNAVGHVVQGLIMRCYNPGLATSLVLFLPLAGCGLWVVAGAVHATLTMHLVGLGAALLVHAAIIGHVKRKLAAG
ncbi:MAG: hypothetical protein Fur0032_03990 [Terrimicrobiaceae bacterium]